MPRNREFAMHITVGDVTLPEYEKNGEWYVECPLDTPYSYKLRTTEIHDGERETQQIPVTPYKIRICAGNTCNQCFYRVFVDGQPGDNAICYPFETRFSSGYVRDGVKYEYVFSMPKLTSNQSNQLDCELVPHVGTILVECWDARYFGLDRSSVNNYTQASKADSSMITKGKYSLTTTRLGRLLCHNRVTQQDYWDLYRLRSRLFVRYRMANDLRNMGFRYQIIPFDTSCNELMSAENPPRTTGASTKSITDDSRMNKNTNVSAVNGTGTNNEPIEITSDGDLSESEGITESQVNANTRPRSNKRNLNTENVNTKRMRTAKEANTIFVAINDNEGRDINHNKQRNIERMDNKATSVGKERDLDDSVTTRKSSRESLLPETSSAKVMEMAAQQLVQATVHSIKTEHDTVDQVAAAQWSEQWSVRFVEKATQQFAQALQKVIQENPKRPTFME